MCEFIRCIINQDNPDPKISSNNDPASTFQEIISSYVEDVSKEIETQKEKLCQSIEEYEEYVKTAQDRYSDPNDPNLNEELTKKRDELDEKIISQIYISHLLVRWISSMVGESTLEIEKWINSRKPQQTLTTQAHEKLLSKSKKLEIENNSLKEAQKEQKQKLQQQKNIIEKLKAENAKIKISKNQQDQSTEERMSSLSRELDQLKKVSRSDQAQILRLQEEKQDIESRLEEASESLSITRSALTTKKQEQQKESQSIIDELTEKQREVIKSLSENHEKILLQLNENHQKETQKWDSWKEIVRKRIHTLEGEKETLLEQIGQISDLSKKKLKKVKQKIAVTENYAKNLGGRLHHLEAQHTYHGVYPGREQQTLSSEFQQLMHLMQRNIVEFEEIKQKFFNIYTIHNRFKPF